MFPYESLSVYQKASSIHAKIYRFLKERPRIPSYVKSQLGRSCLSITLNIAEGSGKLTSKDKRHFFSIARGSAFETASIIIFLSKENEMDNELATSLYNSIDEISRILYAMINNLSR